MRGFSSLNMQTIDAYENDVKMQPGFLLQFKKQKTLTRNQQKNTIFTGSPVPVRQIYVTKGKGPGNE